MPFADLEGLLHSYLTWMEVKAPQHRASFIKRLKQQPESARSEAVTFSILRSANLNPMPAEDVSTGGVDFVCTPNHHQPFVVEVTAILSETVARASGLPHEGPGRLGVRGFSQITSGLLSEAVNKAAQMANYPMARVLVIATEHPDASLLMGAHSATELLAGTTAISVRVGDLADGETQIVATLRNSAFFRLTREGTGVEPARQSISAILLVTVGCNTASAIGILHPAPAHPFDHSNLPTVHFVRLTSWPITDNKLRMEWLGPEPDPTPFYHSQIQLTDEELRSLS